MKPRTADSSGFFWPRGKPLASLAEINRLTQAEKEAIYRCLIPRRIFADFGVAAHDFAHALSFICPAGLGVVRIAVRPRPGERDSLFFVEMSDTPYGQIELSFCVINDLDAPRFNVDVDERGRDNCFATLRRNIPEEVRAMRGGLAPNQVRRGLRMFSEFFAQFENFVAALGVDTILAEPLSYDNAVRYESLGFDYLSGKKLMQWIDQEFRPGGHLRQRLDGSTPFRQPGMEKTVRGRSWAIHDGVLGFPWNGVRIYKKVGHHAGIRTFSAHPDEIQ